MAHAVGIDIGGTGIKGALVDTTKGELLSDRIKLDTPKGGEPDDIVNVVVLIVNQLKVAKTVPVGVCFPAIVIDGKMMSAANVSKKWIDFDAEKLFEKALGRDIRFVNDADAAGVGEVRYGAAKDVPGLVLMTTLGTGIGSAIIYDGVLVPNASRKLDSIKTNVVSHHGISHSFAQAVVDFHYVPPEPRVRSDTCLIDKLDQVAISGQRWIHSTIHNLVGAISRP